MRCADPQKWTRTPHVPDDQQGWKEFLLENCAALFQTALLLSADPHMAQAALIEGMEALSFARPPGQNAHALWERAVVMRSIALPESAQPLSVHPFLQRGLWPVIQIEKSPRICFVLRRLLGYPLTLCAQILGFEESTVQALLQVATLQLQHRPQPIS